MRPDMNSITVKCDLSENSLEIKILKRNVSNQNIKEYTVQNAYDTKIQLSLKKKNVMVPI